MKKRIKLTEKQLAIGMWLYIKMVIKTRNEYGIFYLRELKDKYLSAHDRCNLWENNCILCNAHSECKACPLISCNPTKSYLYQKTCGFRLSKITYYINAAIAYKYGLKTRLKACDKIIEAIEKDIPDDYGDNDYDNDEDF